MKFWYLLRKELREMVTLQMIGGMVIALMMMALIGQIMGGAIEEVSSGTLWIADLDQTELTEDALRTLEEQYTVVPVSVDAAGWMQDPAAMMAELGLDSLIVIPEGLTETLLESKKPAQLETVSVLKNASMLSAVTDLSGVVSAQLTASAQDLLMADQGLSEETQTLLKAPITMHEITVRGGYSAEVSAASVVSLLSVQNVAIPLIVFVLVMFTSQMIITAVSTEKIDKTLETLLSAPVSRVSILGSKMLAAAIVALLNAGVYTLGFVLCLGSYMNQGALSASAGALSSAMPDTGGVFGALRQLHITLGVGDFFLIGVQLFLSILIALSISILLGSMASDAKSVQTLLLPLMICAALPYLITMLTDINDLSPLIRALVYLIPFTHAFSAVSNLMFGHELLFWVGMGYQLFLFLIFMFLALRFFSSDRMFTAGTKKRRPLV